MGATITVVVGGYAAMGALTAVVCVSLGLDGAVAGGVAPVISRRVSNR